VALALLRQSQGHLLQEVAVAGEAPKQEQQVVAVLAGVALPVTVPTVRRPQPTLAVAVAVLMVIRQHPALADLALLFSRF